MSSFQRRLVWSTDGIWEMWHLCAGLISPIKTVNILLCLWSFAWKTPLGLVEGSLGRSWWQRAKPASGWWPLPAWALEWNLVAWLLPGGTRRQDGDYLRLRWRNVATTRATAWGFQTSGEVHLDLVGASMDFSPSAPALGNTVSKGDACDCLFVQIQIYGEVCA